jgi:hypothetical protein
VNHTPGPWTIHIAYGAWNVLGTDHPNPNFAASVCSVDNDDERQGAGTAEANARLVASAPDLLKYLKLLCEADANGELDDALFEQARAVIAKVAVPGGALVRQAVIAGKRYRILYDDHGKLDTVTGEDGALMSATTAPVKKIITNAAAILQCIPVKGVEYAYEF